MNTLRPSTDDHDKFREIAGVRCRLDGPVEMTRVRLGGISLRAADNNEPTGFLGGVTWEEFLEELQDPQKITQEN